MTTNQSEGKRHTMNTTATPQPAAPESTGNQQTDDYNAFSDVFDTLTDAAPPDPAAADDNSTGTPTATDKAAAAATDTPADAGSTESATPVPASPLPADGLPLADSSAPQPESPPSAEDDYKAKFEQLNAQFEEMKAQQAAASAPATQPPAPPAPAAPPLYTDDETAFLAQYDTDWPDIAKGEALKRRAEYNQLVNHVFSEVARVYGPMVREAYEAAQIVGDNTQLDSIRRVHADYDDIYGDVVKWVDTLPGYIKGRAKEVMESGTSTEVVEMISDFKKATGRTTAPAASAPPPAPKPQGVTSLSDAAKKAAKAMGVVDSKRTAGASAEDPNDFDGTWADINSAAA